MPEKQVNDTVPTMEILERNLMGNLFYDDAHQPYIFDSHMALSGQILPVQFLAAAVFHLNLNSERITDFFYCLEAWM